MVHRPGTPSSLIRAVDPSIDPSSDWPTATAVPLNAQYGQPCPTGWWADVSRKGEQRRRRAAAGRGSTSTHWRGEKRPERLFCVVCGRVGERTGRITISVVLADDQAMVRAGLRMILEAEDDLEVVGEASDGEQALAITRRLQPDVVLMDIQMPKMDGLEATRRVGQEAGVRSRVVILTTFERDAYVFEALRAGASGFLLKNAPPEELVHAIRIVAAGDALLAPSITRRVIAEYAQRPAPPKHNPGLSRLTEREAQVLRLLATGKSNAELATHLYLGEGPSRPMCPTCWPSSAYATESKPSSSPTKAASSNPANPDGRPSRRSSGLDAKTDAPAITRDIQRSGPVRRRLPGRPPARQPRQRVVCPLIHPGHGVERGEGQSLGPRNDRP